MVQDFQLCELCEFICERIRTLSSFDEQMLTKNNPENATSSKEVKDVDI